MIDFKEALRALGRIRHVAKYSDYIKENALLVTSALELAEREAEAWEAIHSGGRECLVQGPTSSIGGWDVWVARKPETMLDSGNRELFWSKDRLEALEAAAEWCRAELAK